MGYFVFVEAVLESVLEGVFVGGSDSDDFGVSSELLDGKPDTDDDVSTATWYHDVVWVVVGYLIKQLLVRQDTQWLKAVGDGSDFVSFFPSFMVVELFDESDKISRS